MVNIGSISKPSVESRQNKLAASAVDKTDEIKPVDEKNKNNQKQSKNKKKSNTQPVDESDTTTKKPFLKTSKKSEDLTEDINELVYDKKGKPEKANQIDLKV